MVFFKSGWTTADLNKVGTMGEREVLIMSVIACRQEIHSGGSLAGRGSRSEVLMPRHLFNSLFHVLRGDIW